ncbi:hypothetical protein Xen7305DRAFT_00040330 [Xenococcus sp. PCC 7305]|uniref:hypothetical protein n=1 Tax=Xenococcus sp. PCC 7305 TaxID=102125 RepID=UPI0002AC0998|nr:hypothetical protein [Xenococcus sp. PCC 7305]ELS04304.1 hypothetical protein Xen7305DRAFT_00040330 [Xenococcus sp. PCC 7305]
MNSDKSRVFLPRLKIAKTTSSMILSAFSIFFLLSEYASAGNLEGISKFEFSTINPFDCTYARSVDYFNREVLAYLQENGISVTLTNDRESHPEILLYIDCLDSGDDIAYFVRFGVFQDINSNGKIIYDAIIELSHQYGTASFDTFDRAHQEAVLKSINAFIETWKLDNQK